MRAKRSPRKQPFRLNLSGFFFIQDRTASHTQYAIIAFCFFIACIKITLKSKPFNSIQRKRFVEYEFQGNPFNVIIPRVVPQKYIYILPDPSNPTNAREIL